MVAAVWTDDHAALLRQPVDAEGGEEHVQQAGVIGVLDVLEIELPVVRQRLRETADHHDRLVQHALDPAGDLVAEIFLDRRHVLGRAAEHQAGEHRDAQLARAVVGAAERLRHAALAGDAVLEGDRVEVAFQVVVPGVIDAGEVARIAAAIERDQRPAVRAAVLECVDLARRSRAPPRPASMPTKVVR